MTRMIYTRRAGFRPASLDRTSRTFEAVASTGADVRRQDARGTFLERINLSALNPASLVGTTVLDAHRQGSHRDAVGVIEAARMDGGSLVVTIKTARGAEGDAILDRVEDGILRGVSIGYTAAKTSETRDAGGQRVRTVQPEIREISLVPVPADPGAVVRGTMENEETTIEDRRDEIETRAQTNREIRSIASVAGLSREWADGQIDGAATVDAARAAAFEAMRTRPATVRTATTRNDDSRAFIERRGEALYARANPAHELAEAARQYANDSTVDIARDCLQRAGHPITGLSAAELTTRALHTTSDFPAILGDTVNRTLRAAYRAAPSGLKRAARQTTARDFRAKSRVQLGEAPTLERVLESGEYKRGTLAEAKTSYKIGTFGVITGWARQAWVNDDLGAFAGVTSRMGTAAAAFEAKTLVQLLEANPGMDDGKALFHADHGNLAASGGALAEGTLSAARLAMRKQTGLSGERIDVTPASLVVPPELETTAEKLLSAVQAAKTGDVNPFSTLGLIVEPRLASATAWYVVADTATIDGLEYAYLEGAPGPQIETRQGFDVDGLEIKIRLDFGAGFVDWRGWYKNAGA